MTFSLEAPHFTPAPKGEPGKSPSVSRNFGIEAI